MADAGLEHQKPIPVAAPSGRGIAFRLRRLADLQLDTIVRELRPALGELSGDVLDVGAGEAPWRSWLPAQVRYQGLDIAHADDFGMTPQVEDVVYYDGGAMPFPDRAYDAVLCVEVLEHAADPDLLLAEIARVTRPGGTLLLTIPWSARLHHLPHDYQRYTRYRLGELLIEHGFDDVLIRERGSDIHTIANKLLLVDLRLLTPVNRLRYLPRLLLGLFCAPVTAAFLLAAHLSNRTGGGSKEDPLGYFVRARRAS